MNSRGRAPAALRPVAAIGGAPKSPVQLTYELIAPNSKRPLRRRRSARLPCVSFPGVGEVRWPTNKSLYVQEVTLIIWWISGDIPLYWRPAFPLNLGVQGVDPQHLLDVDSRHPLHRRVLSLGVGTRASGFDRSIIASAVRFASLTHGNDDGAGFCPRAFSCGKAEALLSSVHAGDQPSASCSAKCARSRAALRKRGPAVKNKMAPGRL